jgi:L-ascorbate metabolism protein UlaG (beta-lactamase superfamily)
LTKFSHACVRLEGDGVLVIDPGAFSEPEVLDGVDAVLITHEHLDHFEPGRLADALAKRPSIAVYTNPDVAKLLTELAGVVTAVVPGDEFSAAGFHVRTYGGLHAMIHPELPRVTNLAFFLRADGNGAAGTGAAGGTAETGGGVYHPGDSFDVPTDATVDTLFVPASGPWLKLAEAVEFVRAVAPRRAYALHDGLWNEIGQTLWDRNMSALARCEYARLTPGRSV